MDDDDDDDDDDESEEDDSEEEEEEEEEEVGEEESDKEKPELTRAQRKELKKQAQVKQAVKEQADEDEEDELMINPNRVQKNLTISDLNEPRQLSRRERYALFVIIIWRLSNVHVQGTEGEKGGRGTLLEGASTNFMTDLFAHLLSVT